MQTHLPNLTASFSGGMGGVATLSAVAPRLRADLEGATPTTSVAATLVVGTQEPNPLSFYEQYPYTSFARFSGLLLGASSTGLYSLDDGRDDGGTPVSARVRWGQLHFGTPQVKRVDSIYVAARSDGDLLVRTIANEVDTSEKTLEVRDVATIRARRVVPGKGLRGNYMEVEVENIDGAEFDLDVVTIAAVDLSRRI